MDPGLRTPLLDCFLRGEVPLDVRMLGARGAVAPRAHEQIALLVVLADDPDAAVAETARRTIDALPRAALARFLARNDVTSEIRRFFAALGIEPDGGAPASDAPLLEVDAVEVPDVELAEGDAPAEGGKRRPLSSLSVMERIKLAMHGTREQRSVLVRDANRIVAAAVLSSPKLSDSEIEVFARMTNVSEDVLRVIGSSRGWTKNYAVLSALVRNPKTPPAVSMALVPRLNERDTKMLTVDRNVPEGLRQIARKLALTAESRRK
jgi:hypothetical protein